MRRTATWSIVVGLLAAAPAAAQVRYVDGQGVVHWVQTPEQIPPAYREKAEQPKLPPVTATDPGISDGHLQRLRLKQELEDAERDRHRQREDAQRSLADSQDRFNQAASACAQRSKVKIIFRVGPESASWARRSSVSRSMRACRGPGSTPRARSDRTSEAPRSAEG